MPGVARRVAVAVVALLALVCVADAQPRRPVRVGYLASGAVSREGQWLTGFVQRMQELGYVEGGNLVLERRYGDGNFQRLPGLAQELMRLNLDVLVVGGAPAAHAAKTVVTTVPIVMTNAADPVGTGLVTSLARPGGNVTGLSDFNTGIVAKRLELLKELVPAMTRVGVLASPGNPTNPPQVTAMQEAGAAHGLTLIPLLLRGADDIDPAFAAASRHRVHGIVVLGDPLIGAHMQRIVTLVTKARLPSTFSNANAAELGGLMAYGTDFHDLYRRAADYVDKILKGARPGDLPIQQPSKLELVINVRTARALGLAVPPSLLLRADRVID